MKMTVLATGHFYSSPAFLGWAAVLVAIVTLMVIAAQFVTASSTRALTYSLISDTALLSEDAREKAGPDMRITLGDDVLDNPHVVSIRIEYKGKRDIRSSDFEGRMPLIMEVNAPILKRLNAGADADVMPGMLVEPGAMAVTIGPGLIKRGQVISIDLLTAGRVRLRCLSPLADVTIREAQAGDESELLWVRRVQVSAFTLFAIGLFGWFAAYQTPSYFVVTVFLFGVLGFTTWVARAVGSARRHRGRPRAAILPGDPDAGPASPEEPARELRHNEKCLDSASFDEKAV
jgi:hypothetical protein